MWLTPAQRSFLLAERLIGAVCFTLVLSGLLGWLVFRRSSAVAVWGEPGVAVDLAVTAFVLPLLACLLCSSLVRRSVRTGKVAPLGYCPADHDMLRWLPASVLARSLVLGLLSAVVVTPGILFALRLLHVQHVSLLQFVVCKAALGAALAAIVTPISAVYVMAEETPALRVA